MKKSLWALLLLALVYVPTSSGAVAGRRLWPDLAVTKIQIAQLPGDPPYVVEDESGHTPGFAVFVTIRNIGKATAKGSNTRLEFERLGGQSIRTVGRLLPPMRPRATHVLKFNVDLDFKRRPPLGWLFVVATANSSHTFVENRENNELRLKHFLPVIAHQWKATDFQITTELNGIGLPGSVAGEATRAGCTNCGNVLRFRFSTFDEASKHFVYVPTGPANADFSFAYTPLSCLGSAQASGANDPWPGEFWIDSTIDKYDALVDIKAIQRPPPLATIYCMGQAALQVEWAWQNLETYVGDRTVPDFPNPYDTRLTGHTERTNAGNNKTTWQWTFKADVPGA